MIEVKLLDTKIEEMLVIVRSLRERGHVQGVDFDFSYNPPKFDKFSYEHVYNRCVVFTFYKEEIATWFSLIHQ